MTDELNKLVVYKKALINACDENNFLRVEINKSRRKTQNLLLQNNDLKEVIFELSENIKLSDESFEDDWAN